MERIVAPKRSAPTTSGLSPFYAQLHLDEPANELPGPGRLASGQRDNNTRIQ